MPKVRKLNEKDTFYRSFTVKREAIDEENRTIEVAFSSEEKVRQYFGMEILDHSDVDMTFLASGRAPVCKDHDRYTQIGVIDSARIDDGKNGKIGRAILRFGKGAIAQAEFQDMVDGIRLNISVGYAITRVIEEDTGEESGELPTYRVAWRPFEISTVAVPADESVGVGRNLTLPKEADKEPELVGERGPELIVPKEETTQKREIMPEKVITETTPQPAPQKVDMQVEVNEARAQEKARVKEIHALAKRHNLPALVDKAIDENVSIEQFRGQVLDKIATQPVRLPEGVIEGMNEKETKRYSLIRAINAAATHDWSKAGLERECSQTLAKQYGKDARGFFVPTNINWSGDARRDLTVASTTQGAKLVGTDHRGDLFIDALRAEIMAVKLGARVITGLQGDVEIPKMGTKTTVAFMTSETTAVTEGAPTFTQLALAPKTCAGWVDISRKLRKQSDPSVEAIVRHDIVEQIAAKIDDVTFEGGTTGEPSGIINATSAAVVSLGTNGGAPTYAATINMIKEVAADNALKGALNFLTTPAAWAKMAVTTKLTSTDSIMLVDPMHNMLNGYPLHMSSLMPGDLTKGSGTALSAMFFGNWADIILAFWSGVDIVVDASSLSTIGGLRLAFFQDVDVGLRHDESFSIIKDMITT